MRAEDVTLIVFVITQTSLSLISIYLIYLCSRYLDKHSEEIENMKVPLVKALKLSRTTEIDKIVLDESKYVTDEQLAEMQIEEYRKKGMTNEQIQRAMYGDI